MISNARCIYITAYDEWTCAFKANGVDYILKPVQNMKNSKWPSTNVGRSTTMLCARHSKNWSTLSGNDRSSKYKEKFAFQLPQSMDPLIRAWDRLFCQRSHDPHLHDQRRQIYDGHYIARWTRRSTWPPSVFRANRQYIINIDAIVSVKPIENSKLIIRLKEPNHKLEVDTSRQKSPEFKKWLEQWIVHKIKFTIFKCVSHYDMI